jgi:D-sedoheptulose 7-phosphate isomerase
MSFQDLLKEHIQVVHKMETLHNEVDLLVDKALAVFASGGKLIFCGNGGSAADSQHLAAEFVVRFSKNRKALPAIALTTDSSILTAHPNDFEFETVFSRQVEALGHGGDLLFALTTSGNSANVLKAAEAAKARGLFVVGLTGESGGALRAIADMCLCVPSSETARIQEGHMIIGHYLCQCVDEKYATA